MELVLTLIIAQILQVCASSLAHEVAWERLATSAKSQVERVSRTSGGEKPVLAPPLTMHAAAATSTFVLAGLVSSVVSGSECLKILDV